MTELMTDITAHGGHRARRRRLPCPGAQEQKHVLIPRCLAAPGRRARPPGRLALGAAGRRRHRRAPGEAALPPARRGHPARLPAGHGLRRAVDRDRRVLHHRRAGHADRRDAAGPRPRHRDGPDPRRRGRPRPGQPRHRRREGDDRLGHVLRPVRLHHLDEPQLRRPGRAGRPPVAPLGTGLHRPRLLARHGRGGLPGARLGRNVVVAAGAVVRGEVPDHAVVAGAPAKVVRSWDPENGWQPPLRTPAPAPIPRDVTPSSSRRSRRGRSNRRARPRPDGRTPHTYAPPPVLRDGAPPTPRRLLAWRACAHPSETSPTPGPPRTASTS